ncbi:MAG TPA: SMP-30/gluconolactonase/LRE family protein [Nocardioides sp.]|nr:SMP-30/gluconolactonase/LRE family protein [Nocardioides sp.]
MTLKHLTVIPVPGIGTEDVVVATSGPDTGSVFTGTEDGAIWRVSPDGARVDRVAAIGGRPMGIELEADGRLLVCEADRGLVRVDPGSGTVETVLESAAGARIVLCNNAAIAADGTVWFSDSSAVHRLDHWRNDIVEATCTGRLLRLDPDGTLTVVLDGLDFANGVALAADESYVAVAESGACTVVRHWLTGDRAGTRDHLVPELPGYPDNLSRGSDGLIWVAIATPRVALAERIRRGPGWVRRGTTKVPMRLQPQPTRTVRVQAYDDAGALVHDIDVPADGYSFVTGVREHEGRIWMGSLLEPAIAFVDL